MSHETLFGRVLIVDDRRDVVGMWRKQLEEWGIEVVVATTFAELDAAFGEHQHRLDGIILGGCVESSWLDTLDFIVRARCYGFAGLMIASSGDSYYHNAMVANGCDCKAPEDAAVARLLEKLL